METSHRHAKGKPSCGGCVMGSIVAFFTLRISLSIIYFVLLILLCLTQVMPLFSTPDFSVMNIEASRIVGAKPFLYWKWYKMDAHIDGANATGRVDVRMWATTVNVSIEIPYGYMPQNITQQYYAQDVPCAAFRSSMKCMQIFSLLSIFSGFIVWVFAASNLFTRLFLPLLWLSLWITIAFTTTMMAMMFRILFEGACYGEAYQMPPFTSLAMPTGGFAFAFICQQTYLFTSLLTVFL
ncbi:hypothetical protein JKF63_00689 [Porcisia hertigi]|uniref:Amastin surface glycofamily protein n=1 Tax=Porcisia hertigi TaxID=2761500 RepID=A0A836HFJ6_9TRYP|nr:hypothetical protein JKF63_00689 [Porcisia hertigi]